jgi:hypothetical protein
MLPLLWRVGVVVRWTSVGAAEEEEVEKLTILTSYI